MSFANQIVDTKHLKNFTVNFGPQHPAAHGVLRLVLELNGEVEDSPDMVNTEAYGDGWLMIVRPHDYDEDHFLSPEEYIEFLAEGL